MNRLTANPFADPDLVAGYEAWYEATGRRADRLEKALLGRLLGHFPQARSILEVGCGTGHFTRWFGAQNLRAVGLEVSPPMLVEAIRLGSPPCVRGDALALPFSAGTFDLVALITAVEFIPDPARAIAEALRLARRGLIVGALNRRSSLGRQLKGEGGPVWAAAQFLTPAELVHLIQAAAAGNRVEIVWRTTLWPVWPGALPLPWGGFIGLAARLI